jgi:phosphate uptake regulator
MRQAYQFGLARLNRDTATMCRVAADCLRDATQALLSADLALAEHVISSQTHLAQVRSSAEAEALELLTLQAPVASDLRRVETEGVLMDDQERAMFAAVLAPSWSHGVQAAVDVSLLGRCYERFADHSVAVARRVSFMVDGVQPSALPFATGTGTRSIRFR